jgi:hypothetical protein
VSVGPGIRGGVEGLRGDGIARRGRGEGPPLGDEVAAAAEVAEGAMGVEEREDAGDVEVDASASGVGAVVCFGQACIALWFGSWDGGWSGGRTKRTMVDTTPTNADAVHSTDRCRDGAALCSVVGLIDVWTA